MKKTVYTFVFLGVLSITGSALAQTTQVPSPTPATVKLAFDHDGANTDNYVLVIDGTAQSLGKLVPVAGQNYEVPFPALIPGQHTLLLCAENIAGRSCSTPFQVQMVVQPTPPSSLRIVTR